MKLPVTSINSTARRQKQHGIHYTPVALADFLARATIASLEIEPISTERRLRILDPACGEGELLVSMVTAICQSTAAIADSIELVGFDNDHRAIETARTRLTELAADLRQSQPSLEISCQLQHADFLLGPVLTNLQAKPDELFDCIVSNPPYVRTQVLGAGVAQELAKRFRLSGRVDLYQAFTVAMSMVLKPTGTLGLLTSNRFLTVKSGAAMRELLTSNFELDSVFDLGDTRIFAAAVLPVVVTGRKQSCATAQPSCATKFTRVYSEPAIGSSDDAKSKPEPIDSIEELLRVIEVADCSCRHQAGTVEFAIEVGTLDCSELQSGAWRLTNTAHQSWLQTLRAQQHCCFGDLTEIKVGIKTTADSVFIRDHWDELDSDRPEAELLHPLITHHEAARWRIKLNQCAGTHPPKAATRKRVLYPYYVTSTGTSPHHSARRPIDLMDFPLAANYLNSHRDRLAARQYVIDAGREWYEIWVPHAPQNWSAAKIVWPDISQQPRFALDESGAIVNGDCYWITLRKDVPQDWLYLILAVANSSVVTQFYDTMFHNKLYSGRRRFMTQYVKTFPLPSLEREASQAIVKAVKQVLKQGATPAREANIEGLVRAAFGF